MAQDPSYSHHPLETYRRPEYQRHRPMVLRPVQSFCLAICKRSPARHLPDPRLSNRSYLCDSAKQGLSIDWSRLRARSHAAQDHGSSDQLKGQDRRLGVIESMLFFFSFQMRQGTHRNTPSFEPRFMVQCPPCRPCWVNPVGINCSHPAGNLTVGSFYPHRENLLDGLDFADSRVTRARRQGQI